MPQLHLHAEPGDYAPLVLLPGDPNRARKIAARFDGGAAAIEDGTTRLVNANRGMLGFTGTYQGQPVSVQATGMGTPSISIVVEELLRLGVTQQIRVGTCGGVAPKLRTGDLVIASAASPTDGATQTYLNHDPYAPAPDFALTHRLYHLAEEAGIAAHVGPIASVDVFYNPDPAYARKWRERGVLAMEMEASALFYLAARGGVQAACLLVVSDLMSEEVSSEESYLEPQELDAAVERMIELGLKAAIPAIGQAGADTPRA
jgi:DeoD family purine-nucleoside phosphorylase